MAHASGASARSVPARKGRDLRQRASTRVANCRRAGGDRHLSPDERRRHCLGRRRLPHSGEARIRGRPTARSGGELGHEERPGVVGGLRDPGRTICDTPPPGPSSHASAPSGSVPLLVAERRGAERAPIARSPPAAPGRGAKRSLAPREPRRCSIAKTPVFPARAKPELGEDRRREAAASWGRKSQARVRGGRGAVAGERCASTSPTH